MKSCQKCGKKLSNGDICPECYERLRQQKGLYYEGILQLRNPNEQVIDFIISQTDKQAVKGIFITKEVKVRNGFDYYFTSQRFLQGLGKKLVNNFGGIMKTSKKLFTRNKQESKDVYRVNVLFEAPSFLKDDVIVIKNKVVKVKSVRKQVKATDLTTGKDVSFNYKNIEAEKLDVKETTVAKVMPSLEVLDPETYQPVKVENPKKIKIGKKVKIVNWKGKFWLV
jgi:NMD protein affecting ribosome stability and mRNA decay